MAWAKTASAGTKHSPTCCMAFGRKDPSCPRCQELMGGASARSRFGDPNYKSVAERDREEIAYRQSHYCHCGCTDLPYGNCRLCGKPMWND